MRMAAVVIIGILTVARGVEAGASDTARQASRQAPADQVTVLKVEGMTWTGCVAAVTLAAKSIDGVKDCKTSFKQGTAEVTYDPSKTNPQAIAKVISEKTGFKATAPSKA